MKFKSRWEGHDITLNTENLTENEIKVMIGIRNNDYSDIMESIMGDWSFAVCNATGLDEKVYRGVAASLIKKGFIEIYDREGKGKFEDMVLELTQKGKERYSDY